MPEGPEIRRAADNLEAAIKGKPLTDVWFAFPQLKTYQSQLIGQHVTHVETRGKALLTHFSNDLTLYSHNQLYGVWRVVDTGEEPQTTRVLRVKLQTADKTILLYSASDIEMLRPEQLTTHPFLQRVGPDVLDPNLTPEVVKERLLSPRFRNRQFAGLLLDQAFLAGLGNYLRVEILWQVGLTGNHKAKDKADLTFKKVFSEHPDLVISLLNALLPLEPEEEVMEIEYLPAELVPENPLRKNGIVDVRCKDKRGRQYLVEMQMVWSPEFQQRVLFNASKAYVRQVKTGEEYELLQLVYSLNLVNEVFEPELEGFYHYYKMVHVEHSEKVIDGLHLIFVELPKFNPCNYSEKKMQVLWLRYLTEINEQTREIPAELMENPEIKKAVSVLEESAFTDAQLLGYEKFWDIISVEKTLYGSGWRRGVKAGREKGIEEGRKEGKKA